LGVVLILKGKYKGHHPIKAVAIGIKPISPNQLLKTTPAIIIAPPRTSLTILSAFPTLFFIKLIFVTSYKTV
jgi:hypothetical protein